MSHLAGGTTELDPDVIGRRTNPGRTIIVRLGHLPEAYVMALLRAVPDRLFKCQIFFPSEKIKITDGSLVIRFSQNRIQDDSNAAPEGQSIGGIPLRGDHRADDFLFCSDEGDIEW